MVEDFLSLNITAVLESISRDVVSDRLAELRPRKSSGRKVFQHCSQSSSQAKNPFLGRAVQRMSQADNLQPISFLTATSKLLEYFVQRRVQDDIRNFRVLVHEQSAFR